MTGTTHRIVHSEPPAIVSYSSGFPTHALAPMVVSACQSILQ